MKKYTKETLRYDLNFDIYYTGSNQMAHTFPHLGHILKTDIELDGEIISKGYMLFFNISGPDLQIMSPLEWENDKRSCYKVDKESHKQLNDSYFHTHDLVKTGKCELISKEDKQHLIDNGMLNLVIRYTHLFEK